MSFEDQLNALTEAAGDPARLALVTVDLAYRTLPESDRVTLKSALEIASIAHWLDESILARLMKISLEQSALLLARLRALTVVEPFPARGQTAVNVHEKSRWALREMLWRQQRERFLELSARARAVFADQPGTAFRIEALYHLFAIDPAAAVREWTYLHREVTRYQDRRAIANALDELLGQGILSGTAKAAAILTRIDLQSDRGEATGIEAMAREALTLATAVNDEALISFSWYLIGEALLAAGHLSQATEAYERQLQSLQTVAQDASYPHGWLRELAISHASIAETLLRRGEPGEALRWMSKSLELCQQDAARDPSNAENQRNLASAHHRVAEILSKMQHYQDALISSRTELEILSHLDKQDPGNLDLQRSLALGYEMHAMLFADLADYDRALAYLHECLHFAQHLVVQDPTNARFQRGLASAYANDSFILWRLERYDEALRAQNQYLEISEQLYEREPTNAGSRRELAIATQGIAALLSKMGKLVEARQYAQTAYAHLLRAIEMSPETADWRKDLVQVRELIAELK